MKFDKCLLVFVLFIFFISGFGCTKNDDIIMSCPPRATAVAASADTAYLATPCSDSDTLITNVVPNKPAAITSISPNSGPTAGGTVVTITGTNFTGATGVRFGNINATTFTIISSTQIQATSPAGSGIVDITVQTPQGPTAITPADQFRYIAPILPVITNVSPNSGPATGGTVVTITGTNFTGATGVRFGNTNATTFTVISSTQIQATSPAGSGIVDITIQTPQGSTAITPADQFRYITPIITSVTPNSGTMGTLVTITGTNFSNQFQTTVTFGPNSAFIVSANINTIKVTAPAGTGTVNVTVTTPNGSATLPNAFTYTVVGQPVVTSINPTSGTTGTVVMITGSNFTGATAVNFGPSAALSFTVNSSSQITAVAPPYPGGSDPIHIQVTTPAGTSLPTQADIFGYQPV